MRGDSRLHVFSLTNQGDVKVYKKRRDHSKTKNGCHACRLKRVKCDQERPACKRCIRNDRPCVYTEQQNDWLVLAKPKPSVQPVSSTAAGISDAYLLQHCARSWNSIFGFGHHPDMLAAAGSYPALYSTIMAMSASHLRHLSPTREHRIAEYAFEDMALQQYREMLSTPVHELGQSGVNALILTAVLLNMLAFALPQTADGTAETDLSNSWVFSVHENRLGWMKMQEGLRHLLRSTGKYLHPGLDFMARIMFEPGESGRPPIPPVAHNVPPSWTQFFDLLPEEGVSTGSVTQAVNDHTFRSALHALTKIPLPLGRFKMSHYFSPLLKINAEMRALLLARDNKAIWVLCYWFAAMMRCGDVWWFHMRVRRDYLATRQWLDMAHVTRQTGHEGEMWKSMMAELDAVAALE